MALISVDSRSHNFAFRHRRFRNFAFLGVPLAYDYAVRHLARILFRREQSFDIMVLQWTTFLTLACN
jgi:hypothetical protein